MPDHSSRTLPKRNPRYRQFLMASTISLYGSNVFDFAMPLYVFARTNSVIDLGIIIASAQLPHFLMAPLTGYFSDHSRKRLSLILADLGQVFLLVLLSAYLYSGGQSLWPVFILIFLIKSLMLTFETVSQFQLIPAMVSPFDLTGANAWFLSFHRIIQIIGPATGGFLPHYLGIQSCIWLNLVSFVATLYFTWSFKRMDQLFGGGVPTSIPTTPAPVPSPINVAGRFRDSLKFIWDSPVFRPFIFLMLLWNLSPMTLNSPTILYYFIKSHGFTSAQYGVLMSFVGVLGVGGFVASHLLYRKHGFTPTFYGSAVGQAGFASLCMVPLGFPLVFGLLYGISRACSSVLSAGSYLIRQTRVPRAQSGSINASLRMFFMAAAPFSSVLQGWVIDRFGVGTSIFFGALCLWGTWWYSRKLTRAYEEEEALLKGFPPTSRKSA